MEIIIWTVALAKTRSMVAITKIHSTAARVMTEFMVMIITITFSFGGTGKDSLWGGFGNDVLWGGTDNDTLYGGFGDNIFIYKPGEGTDKIMDYSSGDMLKIPKKNGKEGGTFTKATFKNNSLTLAISGGGKVIFDGVSSGDQLNINGTIRTISGSTLK